jgi:8-oxo-dGTP pyrophosphatase MutT (NUDIX family)
VSLVRVSVVLLVDARGWVLLQERDDAAPLAPGQWGLVGGHVDPGEDWLAARDRELEEETGLRLPDGTLGLWYAGVRPSREVEGRVVDWQIWAGRADLTDDDIVLGEGRQIVFVDPDRIGRLDLAESTSHFLPRFLASATYRRLSGRAEQSVLVRPDEEAPGERLEGEVERHDRG